MKEGCLLRKLLLAVIVIAITGIAVYKGNSTVGTSYYEVGSKRLPASFDGYKIVQLSDLHDSLLGEKHSYVVDEIKIISPQAIFITGDFIDSNRYDLDQSLLIIKELQGIAPIYYVTGNHEIATNDTDHIKESLRELGVEVLTDEADVITSSSGETIAIGGVEDPLASSLADDVAIQQSISRAFDRLDEDVFKILLSHRPEQFDTYASNEIDLTFSGHAHGGQFRIPGFGGLLSPGQGLFPKLTSGVHEKDGSQLVVSRGLGNSIMPVRLFNKPEIVTVTLRRNT